MDELWTKNYKCFRFEINKQKRNGIKFFFTLQSLIRMLIESVIFFFLLLMVLYIGI